MTSVYPSSEAEQVVRSIDDLLCVFHENEKPAEQWLIGTEAEKFGVTADGRPIAYSGETGVLRVLERFEEHCGWQGVRESIDGPVIALRKHGASITLEPAAQLELSGAPLSTVHETAAEMSQHLQHLEQQTADLGFRWLATGFHPFAKNADLPWVPKKRYGVMKQYLPTQGSRGLDMMQRTATVQANFDYASEEDAMRKLMLMLKLSVVFQAVFANSPFLERRFTGRRSERTSVWLNMDPRRSGRIFSIWEQANASYRDYVEWGLEAGMFLFSRSGKTYLNTGQSFRSFMTDGFEGLYPTLADWRTHLNSLFPEVRLKNTIEVRSADSLPRDLLCSAPALYTGLLYDDVALAAAEELVRGFAAQDVRAMQTHVPEQALTAELAGQSLRHWAEQVLDIAAGGLRRRARLADGQDESRYLAPLSALLSQGQVPADRAAQGLRPGDTLEVEELVARCAV